MKTKRKPARGTKPRKRSRAIIAAHPDRQGVGRYSTLTNDKAVRIVKALKSGAHDEVACEHAGVPVRTFYNWLDRGQKELDRILAAEETTRDSVETLPAELPYLQLLHAVRLARSAPELGAVESVKRAWQKGDWRAGVAFVERRHRDRWGLRTVLAGDPEAPLQSHVVVFIPDNGRGPRKVPGNEKK